MGHPYIWVEMRKEVPQSARSSEGGAQWAKLGGEAVLLDSSDFTKDSMHDFNRFVCRISCDCEFCLDIMHPLEYKPESVDLSDNQSFTCLDDV